MERHKARWAAWTAFGGAVHAGSAGTVPTMQPACEGDTLGAAWAPTAVAARGDRADNPHTASAGGERTRAGAIRTAAEVEKQSRVGVGGRLRPGLGTSREAWSCGAQFEVRALPHGKETHSVPIWSLSTPRDTPQARGLHLA